MLPIRAEVATIDAMSAHAGAGDLIAWIRGGLRVRPRPCTSLNGFADAASKDLRPDWRACSAKDFERTHPVKEE